jgi:hypothetical protein
MIERTPDSQAAVVKASLGETLERWLNRIRQALNKPPLPKDGTVDEL